VWWILRFSIAILRTSYSTRMYSLVDNHLSPKNTYIHTFLPTVRYQGVRGTPVLLYTRPHTQPGLPGLPGLPSYLVKEDIVNRGEYSYIRTGSSYIYIYILKSGNFTISHFTHLYIYIYIDIDLAISISIPVYIDCTWYCTVVYLCVDTTLPHKIISFFSHSRPRKEKNKDE
jgi:hypothetical protein